ncbi:Hypothetical protein A7982_09629 [Minicystis rosea]|nr:Hypothetical protein A7982_09629 [Minicystis rosea]
MNGSHLAATLMAYVAFGLLHAASPSRFPFDWPMKRTALWTPGLRLGATLAFVLSCFLFGRREGWGAGTLSGVFAISLWGCVFVIAAPLFPRAVWLVAAAAPVLSIVALFT